MVRSVCACLGVWEGFFFFFARMKQILHRPELSRMKQNLHRTRRKQGAGVSCGCGCGCGSGWVGGVIMCVDGEVFVLIVNWVSFG